MKNKVSLIGAMSIGIGGMVGGGIFAVLGLSVELTKGGAPIAFLLAGLIALLTSISYAKLSLKYPDSGGTVRFINVGFGKGIFSGAINNLLWVSYIIMLSLYASSFGSYAPNLYVIFDRSIDFHIYSSAIIVVATLINYYSAKIVTEIESYAVFIKLFILLAFVVLGLAGLKGNPNIDQLEPAFWSNGFNLVAGGMVIFVAYEGFELIANSAKDIERPQKNIPKAYLYSVLFVIALYITIAAVTVASLDFKTIAQSQEYVLAEAAKPFMGQLGFTIITIAALISTFSAINASLYGGSRVNYKIAEDQELPNGFTSTLWNQPVGLLITSILTLIMTNLVELDDISVSGSIGFLLIFLLVNWVAFKKHKEISSSKWLHLIGVMGCGISLVVLILQQLETGVKGLLIASGIILICFLGEALYQKNKAHI